MVEMFREDFVYNERPPRRDVPLDAFLFEDREGYCQQFSGAMALMLRMAGVPARVASGFSPGVRDEVRDEWVVRDYDAHSWVEAYLPGAGVGS
jgi:transglutaminase-like putative cysteine protease